METKKKTLLHDFAYISIQAGLEIITFFPVLLGTSIYFLKDGSFHWLVILCLQFVSGAFIRKNTSIRRVWVLTVGVLFSFIWIYVFIYLMAGVSIIFLFITSVFFYYRGVLYREKDSFIILPNMLLFISLGLYLVGFFIYSRIDLLSPFLPVLAGTCVVFIPVFFYRLNHTQVSINASPKDTGNIPRAIVSRNRVMVSIALLGVFLLALRKEFVNAIVYIIKEAIRLILFVIFKILSLIPMKQAEDTGSGGPPQLPFSPEEARTLHPVVEWILFVVQWLIIGVVVSASLFLLYKSMKRLIKKLAAIIRKWIGERNAWKASHLGYTDEKELLFDMETLKNNTLNKLKQIKNGIFKKEEKWEDCRNNRERVRFLYRQKINKSISKGYLFHSSYTPGETINDIKKWNNEENSGIDLLTDAYNHARYSEKEVQDSTVENICKS